MGVSSSENIQILEATIGYRFKKKSLLREALTHKSFSQEKTGESQPYNERLEFLGDAVLGLVISHYLYSIYPDYTEAELSKIKAYAVREATLSDIALDLDIGSHLYLGKGEEASGGRKKTSLLANAFEAILAAIYLDGGLRNARAFVLTSLEPRIESVLRENLLYDFKTRFQEVVQEKFGILPKYKIYREEGPEHMKTFDVRVYVNKKSLGTGRGRSKKEAAQKAAQEGLKRLRKTK
ncbi:ribonuclease III [bacterium]|nr:MAG: ribonuclease III [bacterium]